MSQLIEAPLAVAVLPPGRALTDAMVGAAGVLALERVAPWADVTLLESAGGLERYDAQITAHAVAGGVFIDCSVTDLVRAAGALTRGDAVQSALEQADGGWELVFASGDSLRPRPATSPWALLGVLISAEVVEATSEPARLLVTALRRRVEPTSLGLLDPAVGWASAAIDGALGSVAAEDPGRLRRWFTESEVERRTVRAAHDMLRHRYELDLARVAQAEIDGGR